MTSNAAPTDEDKERAKGRLALWLKPNDLLWLSQRCGCDDNASIGDKEQCGRIRFRARAALHTAGLVD